MHDWREDTAPDDPGADERGASFEVLHERHFGFTLGAEVWLDTDALPSAAGGLSAVASLRTGELQLGAFAAWLPGVDRSVGPGQA